MIDHTLGPSALGCLAGTIVLFLSQTFNVVTTRSRAYGRSRVRRAAGPWGIRFPDDVCLDELPGVVDLNGRRRITLRSTAVCPPILLFLLSAPAAHAQLSRLARADKQSLLTENFQVLTHVKALPASVKKAFAHAAQSRTFQMADPGQEYRATDYVLKAGLPFRRLIFAGVTHDLCLLHYERGGRGESWDLVLFRLSGGSARLVWHGWAHRIIPNVAELRKDVRSGSVEDGDKFYL